MKVKRGHLYIADLDPRWGTEAGKQRPVLVIQINFLNEIEHPSTWVLPCTSQVVLEKNILRVHLPAGSVGNHKACDIMVDQSRSIDNTRIKKEIGQLPQGIFDEVVEKLKALGGL